ncbi:MAG: phasin family protein [Clostridia bacterium]
MNAPQPEFIDLYRSGLRNAIDLMKASLQNAERVQQQQLSAIRNALEQNAKSLDELSSAKSLDELVTLQQKLAGAQFERVMGYWAGLYKSAGENQAAAIGKQMEQAREWFNESYSLTARAAEEAGKLASQAPAASAQAAARGQSRQERHSRAP